VNPPITYRPLGDNAIQLYVNMDLSPKLNNVIYSITQLITEASLNDVIEIVPAYNTVTIYYSPTSKTYGVLERELKHILEKRTIKGTDVKRNIYTIPVCYDPPYGEDLEFVSRQLHMTKHELITEHTSPMYLIYLIGFLPGFPYLGGLSSNLVIPRKDTPRSSVSAGSVGIGGEQTGIYPIESPGGWNIIGRTPVSLFNPLDDNPFLLKPGHYIKFEAISANEFEEIKKLINADKYSVPIKEARTHE
jgi:inhibitor of KinA